MKIKVHVVELIDRPDEEFKEYDIEKEIRPGNENRHCDLCRVCQWTDYPACREWCPHQGYEAERRGKYVKMKIVENEDGSYTGIPIDE